MENENESTVKKSRGRPRQYEDSKSHGKDLIKKLKEDGYFKEYYKNRNNKIKCPKCSTESPEINLKQHQRSKRCKNFIKPEVTRIKGDSPLLCHIIDIFY